ncbi:alpha/beta hydrolase [Nocardia lasii]|uniref:Alpha/beta hydrolase n=1 Tax=Nocardia lasii TaxID=1616107 RepID=A0ABW1JP05_9NOCA
MGTLSVALRNAVALFGDGVEPYTPTPSELVSDAPHRRLLRYRRATPATGTPVLLVPPLAVTISCYDMRPSQSLVRFLLDLGREVYVLDYGEITYADRDLGFEEWVDDIVPTAIAAVSAEHAHADVDLIGWSFGGTISVLTAAAHPELPIGSVTAVGTPFDQRRNGQIALARRFGRVTGGREVTLPIKMIGGVPKYGVRAGFRLQAIERELTKPWFIACNITDVEALARMQSVDRFMDTMPGYPGRFYRQAYRQLIIRNEMFSGTVNLGPDFAVDLTRLTAPTQLIGGTKDALASSASVAAGVDVLTGAARVRFAQVPGSHLGIIAGPAARETTWATIAQFLAEVESTRTPARTH